MVLAAGIVGFILGVNLGFLFAGLMRAVFSAPAERRDTHAGYVKLIWTKL